MRIWRITKTRYAAEAFSGTGARRYGGRWNSPGVPMVYASSSLALAAIELFVHIEPNLQPDDLVATAATLPQGEPAQRIESSELPPEWWNSDFAPLRAIGDAWIREKSSFAIEVPSAALREEWNVLVNPAHPRAAEIRIEEPKPFHFDARMFRR
ncbi:MAG TPA: RES family NAD+ phosphorylase [Terracidiphilus sp.]|nr:RES family NAD+ phosphorylase [Terracidiphilus sp.]